MILEFIAHATFKLTLSNGRSLLIDPYQAMTFNGRFNYPPFNDNPDFVLISHEHIDHNYLGDLQSIPVVVRHDWIAPSLVIHSEFAWHDKFQGTKFGGGVWMKLIQAENIRICHMGDCGQILTDEQIDRLGKIDILLIPIGGFYTINGDEAAELVARIRPKTAIPCHYKTPLCSLPIEDPTRFLSHFKNITKIPSNCVATNTLPSGIVLLNDKFNP